MNHQLRATRVRPPPSASCSPPPPPSPAAATTTPRAPTPRPCGSTCSATSATRSSTTSSRRTTRGSRSSRPSEGDLGPVQHPAHPEDRRRQRGRRRGRHRGGPGRQLPPERGQVRELPGPRLQRQARTSGCPGSTPRPPPPTAATPSASAPTSAAWRCATARTCSRRPGCRPTATRSPRCGRPGRSSPPPVSSSRRASAATTCTSSTRRPTPTTRSSCSRADHTYFDTDGNLVIEDNPAVKEAWDTALAMSDAGISAKLKSFSNEWNAGFKNGSVRHHRLPGLDDRLHQGAGRRRERRQVGHRHRARRRRQLGRLVPRRSRPSARTRTWPSSWSTS